jgi:indoleamine 2,3-dioxygenase
LTDVEDLAEAAEVRRGYVVMSFLAHAYVWGNLTGQKDVLPASVAVPWCKFAEKLGAKPIVSYAGVDILNYEVIDPSKELQLG